MDDGARECDQSEERLMEESEEVAGEKKPVESHDGNGIRKRRSDGGSAGERSVEPLQRVVVRNENPFFFWLWFIALVSVVMLVFIAGTSILNGSEKIELLSMPAGVREHFEAGKLVKVEVGRDRSPVKLFVRASANAGGGETALLLHGLGSSSFLYRKLVPLLAAGKISAVAVDLPGTGLSEKSYLENGDDDDKPSEENHQRGFLHVRFEALKALLVEGFRVCGHDESAEHEFLANLRSATKQSKGKKVLALGPDEMGEALDQIVASLELAPVHLVMHDTGVEVGLAWASQNPTKVASLTLIDSLPRLSSLPFWLFKLPLLGPLIAHSDLAFRLVLRSCCFSSVTAEVAEDYDYLLRSNDGLRALLASLAASNTSMDVAGWAGHSHLETIPKQILWASGWSKAWQSEGEHLALALPGASFHSHHGSRWPQEDAAPEIAEMIAEFVKSLPSTLRQHIDYESLPNSGELLYEMAKDKDSGRFPWSLHSQENLGRNHRHHHSHDQGLDYMEGLGQADGVGHGGWVI